MKHANRQIRLPDFLVINWTVISFLFTFLFSTPVLSDNYDLPDLGDPASITLSPVQEKRLGQAFMRSVRATEAIDNTPFVTNYINDLGTRLVNASDSSKGQPFNFFVIDNPQINAFAGPAGNIGVFSGLIDTTQSESELAAVIAHEIAHVTQKHLLRTFERASELSLPSAAVLLAAIALGVAVGGDAGIAAAISGQAALMQGQINFTRSNEQEADSVGISTLSAADFEPHAMPVFFERMGRANRAYATELPEFLRSHPVTNNRIADSLARAEQHPYRQNQDDVRFYLLKTLIKLKNFDSDKEAEKYFRTNIREGRYKILNAERYGLALTLLQSRQYDKAAKELDSLLRDDPLQPAYLIAKSQLLEKKGSPDKSIQLLNDALMVLPENYPLNMALVDIELKSGLYAEASKKLHTMLESRPADDQLYKKLAEAAGKTGDKILAHSYQAEYLYLNGQIEQAIQQLEIALREKPADFYQSSKLEARLENLRYESSLIKKQEKQKHKK